MVAVRNQNALAVLIECLYCWSKLLNVVCFPALGQTALALLNGYLHIKLCQVGYARLVIASLVVVRFMYLKVGAEN